MSFYKAVLLDMPADSHYFRFAVRIFNAMILRTANLLIEQDSIK